MSPDAGDTEISKMVPIFRVSQKVDKACVAGGAGWLYMVSGVVSWTLVVDERWK